MAWRKWWPQLQKLFHEPFIKCCCQTKKNFTGKSHTHFFDIHSLFIVFSLLNAAPRARMRKIPDLPTEDQEFHAITQQMFHLSFTKKHWTWKYLNPEALSHPQISYKFYGTHTFQRKKLAIDKELVKTYANQIRHKLHSTKFSHIFQDCLQLHLAFQWLDLSENEINSQK